MPLLNIKASYLLSAMALMPLLGTSFLITPPSNRNASIQHHLVGNPATSLAFQRSIPTSHICLSESKSEDDVTSKESTADVEPTSESDDDNLTDEELKLLITVAQSEESSQSDFLLSNLAQMPPRVTLLLRKASKGEYTNEDLTVEQHDAIKNVGKALVTIMDDNLESARDLLKSFLQCGEIRKLDGAIGRAVKANQLDMAFFTVLNMNLRDAALERQEEGKSMGLGSEGEGGFSHSGDDADRYQILNHIYTRCQEEVEKIVTPGAGLLNKLLRTDQSSIRANQLRHYLCPQAPKTISTPDGKSVELAGSQALVQPKELIGAFENAIRQIRSVEKTGGTTREMAAEMVESCRQVAIEARLAIGEGYGTGSEELKDFEMGLQPVFRPANAESEYITGA